jgi:hypothetical protein
MVCLSWEAWPGQSCATRYPVEEKKKRMTMQVGFVGSDGIVLASDGRRTLEPATGAPFGSAIRTGSNGHKIYIDDVRGVAISCAADIKAAHPVARGIMESCPFGGDVLSSPESVCVKIEEIARSIIGEDRHQIQLLIVLKNPLWLFRFEYRVVDGAWNLTCDWCQDRSAAGDITNPAMFWSEHYHCETHSMNELTALAAHLIGTARARNSAGVNGLDIVKCSTDGFTRLDSIQCDTLRKKALEWDDSIGEMIFGYGRSL